MNCIESSADPFDESLASRMCARAALNYDEHGKLSRNLSSRVSVVGTRLATRLGQLHVSEPEEQHVEAAPKAVRRRLALAMRLFYFYRTLKSLLILGLQYGQDVYLMKLRAVGAVQVHETPEQAALPSRRLLEENSETYRLLSCFTCCRRGLELLGAPYRDLSIMVALVYLTQVWLTTSMYLRPYLLHRFVGRLELDCLRMLMDSKGERQHYTRLSINVLNTVAHSSRARVLGHKYSMAWRYRAVEDYVATVRNLRGLALRGRLEPPNRAAGHMERLSRLWVGTAVLHALLASCCYAYILGPAVDNSVHMYTSMADLLECGEFLLTVLLVLVCSTSYLASCVVMLADRIRLLGRLDSSMRRCFQLGSDQLDRKCWPSPEREAFNERLLLAMVQYKIAVEHAGRTSATTSSMCLTLNEAALVSALLAMFHAPLLEERPEPIYFTGLLFVMAVATAMLMPVCYVHFRVLKLYRSMAQLAALIVEIELHSGPVYKVCEPHLAWILRAELAHYQLFTRHLAVEMLGSPYDFKRFLRIYLWASLFMVVAAIVANRQNSGLSRSNSLADRLSLGMFS